MSKEATLFYRIKINFYEIKNRIISIFDFYKWWYFQGGYRIYEEAIELARASGEWDLAIKHLYKDERVSTVVPNNEA